jgi:hypothetical protein
MFRLAIALSSLCAIGAAIACSPNAHHDAAASSTNDIVGGTVDTTSYPAVGYLVMRIDVGPYAGQTWRPDCDATLVSPTQVLTAAHCVERLTSQERTVTGVGFGDGHTGRTIAVTGTWSDWVVPAWMPKSSDPDAGDAAEPNYAYDVALVTLAEAVTDLTPFGIAASDRQIPDGTTADEIGYGRVTEGTDYVGITERFDAMAEFPGVRKRTKLVIQQAQGQFLAAEPVAGTTGGVCFGDSGGTLILSDNTVAGILSTVGNDHCDPQGLNYWADLRLPETAAFLRSKLPQSR